MQSCCIYLKNPLHAQPASILRHKNYNYARIWVGDHPFYFLYADNVEKKLSDEDTYKNIGLLAELRDKQSEMRYGKIQSDGTYRSSRSSRYHVMSAPPGVAPPLPAESDRQQREYDKRWSAIYSPYAPGASRSEIYCKYEVLYFTNPS